YPHEPLQLEARLLVAGPGPGQKLRRHGGRPGQLEQPLEEPHRLIRRGLLGRLSHVVADDHVRLVFVYEGHGQGLEVEERGAQHAEPEQRLDGIALGDEGRVHLPLLVDLVTPPHAHEDQSPVGDLAQDGVAQPLDRRHRVPPVLSYPLRQVASIFGREDAGPLDLLLPANHADVVREQGPLDVTQSAFLGTGSALETYLISVRDRQGNMPVAAKRSSWACRSASSAMADWVDASRARRSASTTSRLVAAPAR